jgi:hypothetical protein
VQKIRIFAQNNSFKKLVPSQKMTRTAKQPRRRWVSGDRIDLISDVENAKAELQKKLLRQIYML